MEAIRLDRVLDKDGEIYLKGLPYKKGQRLELILLLSEEASRPSRTQITARKLLGSKLVGLWKDREDIGDSARYARNLREHAQRR
jgi:hypothetical protein